MTEMESGKKRTEFSGFTGSFLMKTTDSKEDEYMKEEGHLKLELQNEEAVLETNQVTIQSLVKEINILKKRSYELLDQIKETELKIKVSKSSSSEAILAEVHCFDTGKDEAGRGEHEDEAARSLREARERRRDAGEVQEELR